MPVSVVRQYSYTVMRRLLLLLISDCWHLQDLARKLAEGIHLSEEDRRVTKLQFLLANYARVSIAELLSCTYLHSQASALVGKLCSDEHCADVAELCLPAFTSQGKTISLISSRKVAP